MKKPKRPSNSSANMLQEKNDLEKFRVSTEVRDKRISIVFKIIYVIAGLFATSFLRLSELFATGLSERYILEASVTAFLLCVLVYLIAYVFNEMKCMKTSPQMLDKSDMDKTESSYSFIFTSFEVSGITVAMSTIFVISFRACITKTVLYPLYPVCVVLASVFGNALVRQKYAFLFKVLSCVFWSISANCTFILVALL
jgi:hypothetical protein